MVKIKRIVFLLILCTIAFCACNKNSDNKSNVSKINNSPKSDTVDVKNNDFASKELIGKFKSDKAPGMDNKDGFIWYFYSNNDFIVMKKDEFKGDSKPSTADVKYGKYKFYEDKAFKITYKDKIDPSNLIFLVVDDENIKIQNVDEKNEVNLKKEKDDKFDKQLSKAKLFTGKYQLYVNGTKKLHGLYLNVNKNKTATVYEGYKKKFTGTYYLFDGYVLVSGEDSFIYNSFVDGFKELKVPKTKNVLKYEANNSK